MKINIKERLKNRVFVLAMATLIITFVYQMFGVFGIVPAISEDTIVNVVTMGVNFLAMIGVLVDPTTNGMGDSERALTYGTSSDVRLAETTSSQIDTYTKEPEKYPVEAHPVSDNKNVKVTAEGDDT